MIYLDVPTPWGIRLQDTATPNAEGIHELYDHIMFYLCLILGLVSYILYVIIHDYKDNRFAYKYIRHGQVIEIIWTIFPAIILLLIAFPSFILLYLCDEVLTPAMTIKVIGLQWYWKYEYSDFVDSVGETIEFESYVIPDDMLEPGNLRLLDTDTSIVVPVDTHIRFVVTANDVIHCFTIPSLGMKVDATPGRLNQVSALIQRTGVYYGQCSELCGVNHGMMPIKLECVSIEDFIEWLGDNENKIGKLIGSHNSSTVEPYTVNVLILVRF
uniref:Cytochrome c oxidase subunit 2 n=1 Tax=Candida tropicalis TaxID=5482 RepID=S5U5B2_CANTR|nr:cytochrome c oxidase subunit 2 [Candida tropicalis]AGS44281.1 cytochrome c oxidase subunit 2 [Candida tropicalis]